MVTLARSLLGLMEKTGDAAGRFRSCGITSSRSLRDGESNGSVTPIGAARAFCLFFGGSVNLLFINFTLEYVAGPPLVEILYYNYCAKRGEGAATHWCGAS